MRTSMPGSTAPPACRCMRAAARCGRSSMWAAAAFPAGRGWAIWNSLRRPRARPGCRPTISQLSNAPGICRRGLPSHRMERAMAAEEREIKRLMIRGTVQKIGYRVWVEREALALGLKGWVRNRRDGSVEVLVGGPPQGVAELIERCRTGPPLATV